MLGDVGIVVRCFERAGLRKLRALLAARGVDARDLW